MALSPEKQALHAICDNEPPQPFCPEGRTINVLDPLTQSPEVVYPIGEYIFGTRRALIVALQGAPHARIEPTGWYTHCIIHYRTGPNVLQDQKGKADQLDDAIRANLQGNGGQPNDWDAEPAEEQAEESDWEPLTPWHAGEREQEDRLIFFAGKIIDPLEKNGRPCGVQDAIARQIQEIRGSHAPRNCNHVEPLRILATAQNTHDLFFVTSDEPHSYPNI